MKIRVRVESTRLETPHVMAMTLVPASGTGLLPAFEPGAHIDVHLPGGLVRSYSLAGAPSDLRRYTIGVLHDRNSRGGSRLIHQTFAAGHELDIGAPRNNFALEERAATSVFIAGGIGITPMLPMVSRMRERGGAARLLYACRSRADAAFLANVTRLVPDADLHFDDEAGGTLDLRRYLANQPKDAHFYCCGPLPMLDAFETIGAELGLPHLHLERFAAAAPRVDPGADHSFEVRLARTGGTFTVAQDRSILDTLLDAGLDLPYSCQAGICGACETGVLEGLPDHRDAVLTDDERARNDRMMVCVSRCLGQALTLDI
jgi:ferredoxin-NADP reductase